MHLSGRNIDVPLQRLLSQGISKGECKGSGGRSRLKRKLRSSVCEASNNRALRKVNRAKIAGIERRDECDGGIIGNALDQRRKRQRQSRTACARLAELQGRMHLLLTGEGLSLAG